MKKISSILFMFILVFSFTLPASAASFDDVKQYTEEIGFLTSKGIINGYTDGTFKPEKPINRIQAVTMILREKQITNFDAPNPNFRDIKPGSYEYDVVAKAVELGIISGKTDPKTGEKFFDPYGSLTRAQMAKILVLAYGLDGDYNKDFKDVKSSHWAYDFIDVLAANNITTGFQDGSFKPEQNLSRQHFAVFMARLLDDSFKVDPNKVTLPLLPIDGINNIALGMTKDQVKNAEDGELIYEDSNSLRYAKQVMGLYGEVFYDFENNKLIGVNVYHDIVSDQNSLEVLEGYFLVMLEDLSAIYGSPEVLDNDWNDDPDGYQIKAYWEESDKDVLLIVHVDYDYSTVGGLSIYTY